MATHSSRFSAGYFNRLGTDAANAAALVVAAEVER
jgi:hypothetical protein